MQPVAPKVRWEWISEGWNLFTSQWQTWVLMTLAFIVIAAIPVVLMYGIIFGVMFSTMPQPGSGAPPQLPGFLIVLFPLLYLLMLCLSAWLSAGMYRTAFKQLRGERIAVGDLFSGGPYTLRLLGVFIIFFILYLLGTALCILPGLAVPGLLFFAAAQVIEGNKGTIDAIKTSIEITRQDWLMFALFAIVLSFLASAGFYLCGIGALATLPLMFTTHAIAYRDCIGAAGAHNFAPAYPPAPPNYGAPAPPNYGVPQPPPPVYSAPPPQPQPAQRFCNNCGAEVRPGSKFCPRCGATMPT